jgi:hypothetical protein
MPKRYILRTTTGKYVGRGHGNDADPSAYGLVHRPSPEDWRNSRDLCKLEATNWQAQAKRLGADYPKFEIIESSF